MSGSGAELREYRLKIGATLAELGKEAGVSPVSVWHAERRTRLRSATEAGYKDALLRIAMRPRHREIEDILDDLR